MSEQRFRRRYLPTRLYAPEVWHRSHVAGYALIIGSTIGIAIIGFLGPSVVTLALGPRNGSLLPPYYLPAGVVTLPEWPAVLACYACIIAGAVGLWIMGRAIADGYRPRPLRLLGLGVALDTLVCLVPPMTSADVLMYASYGRLQMLGRDPYEITVGEIFRTQYDPVLRWTEHPWQDTPSVYGPLLSAAQRLASWLGGQSMHDTVFWLQMMCLIPMLGIGLIVYKVAAGNELLQSRALLLTLVNPAMIWAVLAQAHNEPFAVVLAMAGIATMRKRPWLAGILLGLAGAAKVNMVLYGVAMLWAYRREPRKIAQIVAGAAVPLVLCYVVWQPNALISASRNTTYVNAASWAGPVYAVFTSVMSPTLSKILINIIALGGWVAVGWMLSKLLRVRPLPGIEAHADPLKDPMAVTIQASVILYVSWLVTTPNSFSWYDLMAWAPLALAVTSRLDTVMLWRTTWLSLAYVTGRAIQFSPDVNWVGTRVRDTLCVIAQVLVIVAIVRWYRSRRAADGTQPRSAELAGADSS